MIKISLRDEIKEFENGITIADVAKSIGMGLYKAALGGRIDGYEDCRRHADCCDYSFHILVLSYCRYWTDK